VSYEDFTITEVKRRFQLRIEENRDLFSSIPAVEIGRLLREILAENVPLAFAMGTEKARSELIISPVLRAAGCQSDRRVSLFSGADFSVDPQRGLTGTCDFLFSLSPEQLAIEAPAIAIVEAETEDLTPGIGPCPAEMIGARVLNKRAEQEVEAIYGIVTSGHARKSLRLARDGARWTSPNTI
jgi:hypothetical protein